MNKHRVVMDTVSLHNHMVTFWTAFKVGAGLALGLIAVTGAVAVVVGLWVAVNL